MGGIQGSPQHPSYTINVSNLVRPLWPDSSFSAVLCMSLNLVDTHLGPGDVYLIPFKKKKKTFLLKLCLFNIVVGEQALE